MLQNSDLTDIDNRTGYHPPLDDETKIRHEQVRAITNTAMQLFREILPKSREASLADTHLEQAMMWANAAIARMDEAGVRR